jgi:hypothetical protein
MLPLRLGSLDLFQICVATWDLPDLIEWEHPLATANGSALCGDVPRDLASAAFTLPSFDTGPETSGDRRYASRTIVIDKNLLFRIHDLTYATFAQAKSRFLRTMLLLTAEMPRPQGEI